MAKKKQPAKQTIAAPVTAERAARLHRLLQLLGRKPMGRNALARVLKLTVRGFYRDLETLRLASIEVELKDGMYYPVGEPKRLLARLPFPDPGLTLGEAIELARGRSKAHRKLTRQIKQIQGK